MKQLLALALLFVASVTVTFAQAADSTDCISDKDLLNLRQTFQWKSNHPKYANIEKCNSADLTNKIAQALLFLKNIRFDSSKAQALGSDILGQVPYEYFKSRVEKIVFDDPVSKNCLLDKKNGVNLSGTVAYVETADRSMHVCEWAESMGRLELVEVLVHEARHLDGLKFQHVRCTHGYYSKLPGMYCDRTYNDQGSYAVGVEFGTKMFYQANLDPALRQSARNLTFIDLYQRFNSLPLNMKEGALVQSEAGAVDFFDGTQLQLLQEGTHADILARHHELPLIYNPEASTATFLLPSPPLPEAVYNVFGVWFNKVVPSEEQMQLLDVYHGPYFSCYLTKTKLRCADLQRSVAEIAFSKLRPLRLFSTSSSLMIEQDQLAVLMENRDVYILPRSLQTLKEVGEKAFTKVGVLSNIDRFDAWKDLQDQGIALTRNGALGLYQPNTREFKPFPMLQGRRFKNMFAPYLYSPVLREL